MKIDNKLVGKAIARLREMRGLTQAELNDSIGMSTIQHIEQGRNAVSLTCLNKIASALDMPAACIVLLGSNINEDDKLLASLHSLMVKTLEATENPTKPGKRNTRREPGNKKQQKPKKEKAMS